MERKRPIRQAIISITHESLKTMVIHHAAIEHAGLHGGRLTTVVSLNEQTVYQEVWDALSGDWSAEYDYDSSNPEYQEIKEALEKGDFKKAVRTYPFHKGPGRYEVESKEVSHAPNDTGQIATSNGRDGRRVDDDEWRSNIIGRLLSLEESSVIHETRIPCSEEMVTEVALHGRAIDAITRSQYAKHFEPELAVEVREDPPLRVFENVRRTDHGAEAMGLVRSDMIPEELHPILRKQFSVIRDVLEQEVGGFEVGKSMDLRAFSSTSQ